MPQSALASYLEIEGGISALQESPQGTSSFKQDQYHAIAISAAALCLGILACAGMWGLIAIIFNVISRRWQIVTWTAAMIAGFGFTLLRLNYIGPQTDHNYIIMVIIVPALVGAASIFGVALTLMDRPKRVNLAN
jgi:hypothetical protein